MMRAICLAAVLFAGCTNLQPVQPGDEALSCRDLTEQFAESQRMREEAIEDRARAGLDPARARFMWPSLLGVDRRSVAEIEHARAAAEARSAHLAKLLRDKRCPLPSAVVAMRT
jgi:hypothetical protein